MDSNIISRKDFDKLLALKSKYKIPFYRYKFDFKEIGTDKDFVDLYEILNLLKDLQCQYEYGQDIDDEDINYIEQMINKIEEIVFVQVQN